METSGEDLPDDREYHNVFFDQPACQSAMRLDSSWQVYQLSQGTLKGLLTSNHHLL